MNTEKPKFNFLSFIASDPLFLLSASLLFLALVVLAWAIIFRIKATVKGVGFIISGERIVRVFSPAEGRITKVHVKKLKGVRRGDLIAEIDNVLQENTALSDREVFVTSSKLNQQSLLTKQIEIQKKIKSTKQSMQNLSEQNAKNKKLVEGMKKLGNSGDISQLEFFQQEQSLRSSEIQLNQMQGSVEEYESELLSLQEQLLSENIQNKYKAKSSDYQFNMTNQIIANVDGKISLINVEIGDVIQEGGDVAAISMENKAPEGIFIMSAESARKLKVGDQCLISPAETPAERFGFLKGSVSSVGELPTNPNNLQSTLGLDYTVDQIFEYASRESSTEIYNVFPFIVKVKIHYNSSGKPEWSTGLRPPWGFRGETAGSVECIYAEWRPISYVVPFLKQESGFGNFNKTK